MNVFNDLATSIAINYSSNLLEEVIDKELHKKNELEELSGMICKTLELTNFIEDNARYELVVEKESDTVLNFKVTKYV